jgi:hypothetical protein
MTFYFLGVLATPSPDLAGKFAATWPDADVIAVTAPLEAVAVRLPERCYDEDRETVPAGVAASVRSISEERPEARFLLLATACFGGDCLNCGRVIQNGSVIASFEGDGALRRLLGFFGVDIGEREYFAPLTRDFPWTKLRP